jgi:hypothetical protein
MVDFTLYDYGRQQKDGDPDFLGQIADTAVDAMCNIYYKSPGSVVAREFPGTPIVDGVDAFYRNLCAPKGKAPPLPTPPFSGGQCCNSTYSVGVTATLQLSNGQSVPFNASPQNITGRILGVEVKNSGTGQQEVTKIVISTLQGGDCSIPTEVVPRSTFVHNSDGTTSTIVISSVNVTLVSGSDNCGSPPAKYPTAPLDDSDFDFSAPITVAPNVTINVPVTIIPTTIVNTNVFRPEFNVKVGDINVNLSLGGFTFSPTVQIPPGTTTPSGDPRALPPPAKTNDPTPDPKQTALDLSQIKAKLEEIDKEIEDCCDALYPFQEPPSGKVRILLLATANSMDVAIPAKTFKVTLELTGMPTEKKIQFGNDAPDVLYAGWAWFSDGVRQYERCPVDSEFKFYIPPDRTAKRFSLTLYQGYVARVLAYYIE